jgi:serine phosphatase RsbU (regulator of sigma subunit)
MGAFRDPALTDTDVTLGPGELLLMFTDGVTEAGLPGKRLGEEQLVALMSGAADDLERLLDEIEGAAVSAQPGEPRDDIALLAIAAR